MDNLVDDTTTRELSEHRLLGRVITVIAICVMVVLLGMITCTVESAQLARDRFEAATEADLEQKLNEGRSGYHGAVPEPR